MIFTTTLLKKYFDANLLFPDTDSLTNDIKSKDVYDKFLNASTCLTLMNFNQIYFVQLTK